MEHSQLLRVLGGDGVHAVEGEVEAVRVGEGEGLEHPMLVLLGADEFLADVLGAGPGLHDGAADGHLLRLLPGDNHRAEHAGPSSYGDHAVGGGGVVEDAVPLAENLRILPHLHLQLTGEDDVELLPGVCGEMDGHPLLGLVVLIGAVVGLRQLVAEEGGQVGDFDALLLGGLLALPPAGDGVAAQVGAVALQQVGDADTEGQRTLVDEGEGQVRPAGLIGQVLGHGGVGFLGHLLLGEAADPPHLLDPEGHLGQLICHAVGFHVGSSSLSLVSN